MKCTFSSHLAPSRARFFAYLQRHAILEWSRRGMPCNGIGLTDMEDDPHGHSQKKFAQEARHEIGGRREERTPTGRSQGLQKAVQPSSELAAIVGHDPLPRTEITKKLWDYIKAHNLQDAQNKRQINADATLGPIFGGKTSISMF